MSISNSIRLSLNIKDPNIIFENNCVQEVSVKGILSLVYDAVLSPPSPDFCPNCGASIKIPLFLKMAPSFTLNYPMCPTVKQFFDSRNNAIHVGTALIHFLHKLH